MYTGLTVLQEGQVQPFCWVAAAVGAAADGFGVALSGAAAGAALGRSAAGLFLGVLQDEQRSSWASFVVQQVRQNQVLAFSAEEPSFVAGALLTGLYFGWLQLEQEPMCMGLMLLQAVHVQVTVLAEAASALPGFGAAEAAGV